MRSLNNYKITYNNQETMHVEAHDFDIVVNGVIFTKDILVGSPFATGVRKEKILAIAGGDILSIELVETDEK